MGYDYFHSKTFDDAIWATQTYMSTFLESLVTTKTRTMESLTNLNENYAMFEFRDKAITQKQNAIFRQGVNNIKRLQESGISTWEEMAYWKELDRPDMFGENNAWIARNNAENAHFNMAKEHIENQSKLGNLSAEMVAGAWYKVYEDAKNLDFKGIALDKYRDTMLKDYDDYTAYRREDSDRWMKFQDTKDGGDNLRQIEDYNRRIAKEKELQKEIETGYLNGINFGKFEEDRRWIDAQKYIEDLKNSQLKSALSYLNEQQKLADNFRKEELQRHYDTAKAKYEQEYKLAKQCSDKRVESINAIYDAKVSSLDATRQTQELNELKRLASYYKQSVTAEGQDKYASYNQQIQAIYDARDKENWRLERDEQLEYEQKLMERAKVNYDNKLTQLEEYKNKLIETSEQMKSQTISDILGANSEISKILADNNVSFSKATIELTQKVKDSIISQFDAISDGFSSFGIEVPNAEKGDRNLSVIFNDYGDKNTVDNQSTIDYSRKLSEALKNQLRSLGGK